MPQMKRPIFLSQVRPDGFISPVGDKTLQSRETALNQIEKKKLPSEDTSLDQTREDVFNIVKE